MSDDWDRDRTEERMAIAEMATQTEPELLAAIDHQDHATRIVYADWLEEHDDHERAEFVRLQDELVGMPDGIARDHALARARDIAMRTDVAWRVLVARPRIERCGAGPRGDAEGRGDPIERSGFTGPRSDAERRGATIERSGFAGPRSDAEGRGDPSQRCDREGCPGDWGSLAPTHRTDVRACMTCNEHVHYCASEPDVWRRDELGQKIVFDPTIAPRSDRPSWWRR